MSMARVIAVLLVPVVIALAPVGSTVQAQEQPIRGGTLVVAIGGDPPTLNPHLSTLPWVWMTGLQVYNSLVRLDSDMRPGPELAESWTVSPDSKTYTFRLRKGVRWHDGRLFTSGDVKFTFEQVASKVNVNGRLILGELEEVATPDLFTAVFKFKNPNPSLLLFLDIPLAGAVLPRHIYEGTDVRRNPANLSPVGTGPFRFVEFVKGSHIALERNASYWKKGLPLLNRVVLKVVPDPTARVLSLENKEVDLILGYDLAARDVPGLRVKRDVKVSFKVDAAISGAWWMGLNMRGKVTGNLKVRQAIAHAINKNVINQTVFFGQGKVATGPVSSFIKWAYNPNVPKYANDPKRANQLLDEAGFPRGPDGVRFPLSFVFDTTTAEWVKIGEILKDQLAEVGIDLVLEGMEFTTWQVRVLRNYQYDIARGRRLTGPDPLIILARDYLSSNIRPGQRNYFFYSNPRVDELFARGIAETDPQKRKQILFEIQEIIAAELPNIFLIDAPQPNAFRGNIVGLENNPYGVQRLEEVWVKR